MIWTFNDFGIIYLLTGGGPGGATRVYTILAYEYAAACATARAMAVAMTRRPALAIIILFLGRYMIRESRTRATAGTTRARTPSSMSCSC